MAEDIYRFLPLTVTGVTLNDPMFSFFGSGWALGVGCPWIFETGQGSVDWECEEKMFEDFLLQFQGVDLVSAQIPNSLFDPSFTFSNGDVLKIVSNHLSDPWSLEIEGMEYVLVGRNFEEEPNPELSSGTC